MQSTVGSSLLDLATKIQKLLLISLIHNAECKKWRIALNAHPEFRAQMLCRWLNNQDKSLLPGKLLDWLEV
jgi:hypothetical protein